MGFMASYKAVMNVRSNAPPGRVGPTDNVNVAEFVQPEVVNGSCCSHEVSVDELLVSLDSCNVELVQDPFLNESFGAAWL